MDLATFITQYILVQNDVKSLMGPEQCHDYFLKGPHPSNKNQLLINNEGGEVFLGVQFETKISPLLNKPALPVLQDIPKNDLSIIVEEISHLVYSLFYLQNNQPISQLELEVQAEIDRFVFFQNIYNPQWEKEISIKILHYFFSELKLHSHVNTHDTQSRYREAHRLGMKACQVLTVQGETSTQNVHLLCRDLFRTPGHQKLDAIEKLKAA